MTSRSVRYINFRYTTSMDRFRNIAQLIQLGAMALLCVSAAVLLLRAPKQVSLAEHLQGMTVLGDIRPIPIPPQYPWGGRTIFPDYRLIGLYGAPSYPALGVLGEQDAFTAADRAIALANEYQANISEKILPMFEIITTVASANPTDDADYSQEIEIAIIKPWIEVARQRNIYVVLDFQSGRESFLSQVQQYQSLLAEPHVGIALDPEWRLQDNQLHLQQIGSVSATEVNEVATWLSQFVKSNNLPQKLLMVHQFRLSMIEQPEILQTNFPELAYVIQMDGQGSQSSKIESYAVITQQTIAGVNYGWKNFYDEDTPTRSPMETMQLQPVPWFVSYQ